MKKNDTQHYIIFDIDSGSIAALVFERSLDKKTKKYDYVQIFSIRENITTGHLYDFETFFSHTLKTFESVASQTHKYSGSDISNIYINISAPWVSSQKRIIHFEKEKPFIFNKEIAGDIIAYELNESFVHTRDFKDNINLSLIERQALDIFANGYPTKKPYGKKVTDIDIHSLVTVMSEKTRDAFTHVIERAFHVEPIYFSNIFMAYQTLLKLFPHENNITHIDISAEVTEMSIIIDDHLKKIGTIPVGMYHIIRKLADLLQIPFIKAESLIKMYQNNNLDEKYKDSIELAMKKSFTSWFSYFYNFLDTVAQEYIIPDTLSILAPSEMQVWVHEWMLKTEELGEHMHIQKNISLLDMKILWRESKKTELKHINDDNLALCLEFVEQYYLSN